MRVEMASKFQVLSVLDGADEHLESLTGQKQVVEQVFEGAKRAIYALYTQQERGDLWESMRILAQDVNTSWLALGNYNNVLKVDERIGGRRVELNEFLGFQFCLEECELFDMKQQGYRYTWSNKQVGEGRISSKIDRGLINGHWIVEFPSSIMSVLSEGVSNHTPLLVQLDGGMVQRPKPFKFFNMWAQDQHFRPMVQQSWLLPVKGTAMFTLVTKLKRLKRELKFLNKHKFAYIQLKERKLLEYLTLMQETIHLNGGNASLHSHEEDLRKN
ncbi:OLC1v1024944C1 [Oldenlandia corymbosa var. corymbosa]|uniref:OLC1v1024944C1 n=1 Tax=Oldenlandia corymbosa var. corymbosa TaxID=529605 RepID=A0AAV1C599_OLDCO|nr:OLC1v1024944C1 [Oldenlandia corymbosa var. corymbosa]